MVASEDIWAHGLNKALLKSFFFFVPAVYLFFDWMLILQTHLALLHTLLLLLSTENAILFDFGGCFEYLSPSLYSQLLFICIRFILSTGKLYWSTTLICEPTALRTPNSSIKQTRLTPRLCYAYGSTCWTKLNSVCQKSNECTKYLANHPLPVQCSYMNM